MVQLYRLCLEVSLLWLLSAGGSQSLSVHIQAPQAVHVIPASSLILHTQIRPLEQVSTVTWQREAEHGRPAGQVTLATFPGKTPGGRVHLDQQGATLRLEGFTAADSGRYTVTVTDQSGAKASDQCTVTEYVAVHHVSVSVNASHASLFCSEAWGSEPRFSWLHDNMAITEATGRVAPDGRTLFFSSSSACGHFTCVVSNQLGHSSATYTAEPCERGGGGTTAGLVWVLLLLGLGAGLALLLWRRRRRLGGRGERLQEHLEEPL